MMAKIPMSDDVMALIGESAHKVENRSLLLDKYVFHKQWPVLGDQSNQAKWDEASRWSLTRISDNAAKLLTQESKKKQQRSRGKEGDPSNRLRSEAEANLVRSLIGISWDSSELQEIRAQHTRRFLDLFSRAHGDNACVLIGELKGRLAINLADGLIQNAGICLDRLTGLPYIPGSAVKGVCRAAARAALDEAPSDQRSGLLDVFCKIFGTAKNDFENGDLKAYKSAANALDCKGAIAFLPAYPTDKAQIVVDLTNVHYPKYYQYGNDRMLNIEKPNPNPFPCVESGAHFAFCLLLNGMSNDHGLLNQAYEWLKTALTIKGIGAKTCAGYGWFAVDEGYQRRLLEETRKDIEAEDQARQQRIRDAALQEKKRRAEEERLVKLSPEELAMEQMLGLSDEQFAGIAKNLDSQEDSKQRAVINLLRNHPDKRQRWKTWKKKKPDLAQAIAVVAEKLKMEPLP